MKSWGSQILLVKGETIHLPEDLNVALKSFSHKRFKDGDEGMASAQLEVQQNGKTEQIELNYTSEKSIQSPGASGLFFRQYEFILCGWKYGDSIEIKVKKEDMPIISLEKPFVARQSQTLMTPEGLRIKISEIGTVTHPESRQPVKFAKISFFQHSRLSEYSETLYENGTIALVGSWVGEPGIHYSGWILQLKKFNADSVELLLKKN